MESIKVEINLNPNIAMYKIPKITRCMEKIINKANSKRDIFNSYVQKYLYNDICSKDIEYGSSKMSF